MRFGYVGLIAAVLAGCGTYREREEARSFEDRRDPWRTQPEHIYPPYIVPYSPMYHDQLYTKRTAGSLEMTPMNQEFDERLGREELCLDPSNLTWKSGPDGLPEGAQMAVLSGDPKGEGLYTIRLKFPAGYRIQPHSHPRNKNITVISGSLYLGFGETFLKEESTKLTAGSYAFEPAGMNHYAWTDEETVIQIHGRGPSDLRYVRIEDDPRKK